MQVPSTFGERLLLARRRARLSQEDLGAQVGLTGHTIGRLERGHSTQISHDALRRIGRVLGISLDWLLAMDIPSPDDTAQEEVDGSLVPVTGACFGRATPVTG
jgi:transcriptional regulator with XRE-family HTH domain